MATAEAKPDLQNSSPAELLAASPAAGILLPAYEAAIKADPRLERVNLVAVEEGEESTLGYARHHFDDSERNHEVHFRLGEDALQNAQELIDRHALSVDVTAWFIGVKPAHITPEILMQFVFLHEYGHTADYINNEDDPKRYENDRATQLSRLPIPNMTPKELRSEAGRRFVEAHWDQIHRTLKVNSFDELLRLQTDAYMQMPSELVANRFAARLLRREQTRSRGVRALTAKALGR